METAKPIAGAQIGHVQRHSLELDKGAIAKSAEDGSWQLAGLPVGLVTIQAGAKGYASGRVTAQMIGGAKNTCNLTLEPGATVRVKVVDKATSPIAEARVDVSPDYDSALNGFKETKTDDQGMAILEGISRLKPPQVEANKDGYNMNSESPIPAFPAGSRVTDMTIMLNTESKSGKEEETSPTEKLIAFKGRITNNDGAAIRGAEVNWGNSYSIMTDIKTGQPAKSGEDGAYRLEIKKLSSDGIILYTYNNYMAVFAKGYAPAIKKQPTGGTAESPLEVNFKLDKAHWAAGVVVTAKGAPIEGLDARMAYSGESEENNILSYSRQVSQRVHTDADGKFRFEDLPNRAATISLLGKGWTSLLKKPLALDQETRIVMKEAGVLKGLVVDGETQTPVKAFTVKAWGARSGDENANMEILFNSPDGTFTLYDLEQDVKYSLMVSAEGFVAARQGELKAGPEADAKPMLFKLSKGAETKGIVLDGASQQPLAGAIVALSSVVVGESGSDEQMGQYSIRYGGASDEDAIRVMTGADGSFTFREGEALGILSVKALNFTLLVIPPNERNQYGGAHSLRIALKRGGAVKGTITFGGKPLAKVVNVSAYRTNPRNIPNAMSEEEGQSNETQTDANGAYRISGLWPGAYQLSLNGTAANSGFTHGEKFDLAEGEEKVLDISIAAGAGALFGRVLKGQAPLPGAPITISPKRNENGVSRSASSNQKGEYRIEELEDGAYSVSVFSASGEVYPSLSEEVAVAGETQKDFTLAEKRKVSLKIVFDGAKDSAQAPWVQQANLFVTEPSDLSKDGKNLDSHGICMNPPDNLVVFQGRFKGVYRLSIHAQTSDNQRFTYSRPEALTLDNLEADQDLGEVHIAFQTGSSLKGTVVDTAGKAVRNAEVLLSPETRGSGEIPNPNSTTNEEGRYEIFGLHDGAYLARVYVSRNQSRSMKLTENIAIKGATEHDFILLQSYKVTATLTVPKGSNSLLPNIQSAFLARQGLREDPGKDPLQITSYTDGEIFRDRIVFVGRFMGDYVLSVKVKDNSIRIPGTFKLDNMDRDQDLGEIPLPTMGSILLRITAPNESFKRPNYCQLILMPLQPQPDNEGPVQQTQSCYSVDSGKAEQEIGPVPEGSYRAVLMMDICKGDPMIAPVTVNAGERATVSFALRPWITLSGSIDMPNGFPKGAMPSLITLSGPGGTRTVTPQKRPSLDMEARLLGKDVALFGSFTFQNLQEGTWRLTVEAEGCQPFSKNCEAKLGESQRMYIRVTLKAK
ncbi:MAG: carboxypeptidase-like regulatory domain-containing protein [Candidatus Sumerlaeota bacterium]|nr:carboxypeptidase-like regulatory domain-containing protein [Candidatus Sumerlaeota bacterium]